MQSTLLQVSTLGCPAWAQVSVRTRSPVKQPLAAVCKFALGWCPGSWVQQRSGLVLVLLKNAVQRVGVWGAAEFCPICLRFEEPAGAHSAGCPGEIEAGRGAVWEMPAHRQERAGLVSAQPSSIEGKAGHS